jgi:hypothetical protein
VAKAHLFQADEIWRALNHFTTEIERAGCKWETGWSSETGESWFRVWFPCPVMPPDLD